MTILEHAKEIFRKEAKAILALIDRIDENFIKAVTILQSCSGKVIVTGIGKSGIISQKIASTLSCSGTPAFFLHPAEGIHGDIGMVECAKQFFWHIDTLYSYNRKLKTEN